MKHIQAWFERIAGISRDEAARLARAREIFAASDADLVRLQLPACWRRTPRIRVIPFQNQPMTLPASLAGQPYCLRFAFASSADLKME